MDFHLLFVVVFCLFVFCRCFLLFLFLEGFGRVFCCHMFWLLGCWFLRGFVWGFLGGGGYFWFDPMLLIEFVSVALSYHKRKKKILWKICVLYCLVSLNSYPVCGMVHIKEPLLLIEKSSPCGGSGFPLSLSEWSFTICLTPYNRK